MSILVTIDIIDNPQSIDWSYISKLVLVNVGQPGYINIKRKMKSVARECIFDELTTTILFPPVQDISKVTDSLLTGIGNIHVEQDNHIIIYRGGKDVGSTERI